MIRCDRCGSRNAVLDCLACDCETCADCCSHRDPHPERPAMAATQTAPKPSAWPLGPLVEEFPITLPDGRVWKGACHKHHGQYPRKGGRRIVARDETGKQVFDSDECYDAANAANRLDLFLSSLNLG